MYGDTFSSADRQSIQEFLTLCRMEHEIEELLGGRQRVLDFRPGRVSGYMKKAGRRTAEKLRLDLRLGSDPIADPFGLARQLGCHVFRRKLHNSSVSGVMFHHDDFGPCILVNYVEGYFRQNFSVAHELCHALLDGDHSVSVTFARPDDGELREDLKKREWRANEFAAHLLFPQSVRKQLPLGYTDDDHARAVINAARSFRVNPIVVLYALRQAGRLPQQKVQDLRSRLRVARREQNAADMATETPKRRDARKMLLETGLTPEYVEICLRAHREGEISYGKLANALLVSPVEVRGVVSNLGLDAAVFDLEAL